MTEYKQIEKAKEKSWYLIDVKSVKGDYFDEMCALFSFVYSFVLFLLIEHSHQPTKA